MEKTTDFRIVFCTIDSFEAARHIAKILVTEKTAACCSIIPNIFSVFSWQGAIQERNEFLILIKTTAAKLECLETRIKELHSDETPELIAVNITEGLFDYLNWIKNSIDE